MVALISRMLFLENCEDNERTDWMNPPTHLDVLSDPEIPGCSDSRYCSSDHQSVRSCSTDIISGKLCPQRGLKYFSVPKASLILTEWQTDIQLDRVTSYGD